MKKGKPHPDDIGVGLFNFRRFLYIGLRIAVIQNALNKLKNLNFAYYLTSIILPV